MNEKPLLSPAEQAEWDFHKAGTWPRSWRSCGHRLRSSAGVLWGIYAAELQRLHSTPVKPGDNFEIEHALAALMLMGMGLEAMLKGILIARDPKLVDGGRIAKDIISHDLAALSEKVGIALDANQKSFVERLGAFVVWRGRYPVPLQSQEIYYPRGCQTFTGRINDQDWEAFEEIFWIFDETLRPLERDSFLPHALDAQIVERTKKVLARRAKMVAGEVPPSGGSGTIQE